MGKKEPMKEILVFSKDKDYINIQIDIEGLVFAVENNPDNNFKIIDKQQFAELFLKELEHFAMQNATEKGITEFQQLLDNVAEEVYVSAPEDVFEDNEDPHS